MELYIFQLWVNNLKVEKWEINPWVCNKKGNLMFYKAELVTQKKNFCKHFQVINSKSDVILGNSIL